MSCRPALEELPHNYQAPSLTVIMRDLHAVLGLCPDIVAAQARPPSSWLPDAHACQQLVRHVHRATGCIVKPSSMAVLECLCLSQDTAEGQSREAGVKRPKVLVELDGLCIRSDTFPLGSPHVSRLAVSLQQLEVGCLSWHRAWRGLLLAACCVCGACQPLSPSKQGSLCR